MFGCCPQTDVDFSLENPVWTKGSPSNKKSEVVIGILFHRFPLILYLFESTYDLNFILKGELGIEEKWWAFRGRERRREGRENLGEVTSTAVLAQKSRRIPGLSYSPSDTLSLLLICPQSLNPLGIFSFVLFQPIYAYLIFNIN